MIYRLHFQFDIHNTLWTPWHSKLKDLNSTVGRFHITGPMVGLVPLNIDSSVGGKSGSSYKIRLKKIITHIKCILYSVF